jgi:hypothetical protein
MCVITDDDKYIIRINPLAIIDDRLNHYFSDDLENKLGISSFNISLLDIANYLINKKSSVSESILTTIIKRVIKEQDTNYEPCGRNSVQKAHIEDEIFMRKFYDREGYLPFPKQMERIGGTKRIGDYYPEHPKANLTFKSFYLCKSKVFYEIRNKVEDQLTKELGVFFDDKSKRTKSFRTNDGKYRLRSEYEIIFYNTFLYYGKVHLLEPDSTFFYGKCGSINKQVDFIYDNRVVIEIAGMESEDYFKKINLAMECIKNLGYDTKVYYTRELQKSGQYWDFYTKICKDFGFEISPEIKNDPFILTKHLSISREKMEKFINDNIKTTTQISDRNKYEEMSKYIKKLYNMSVRDYRKKIGIKQKSK